MLVMSGPCEVKPYWLTSAAVNNAHGSIDAALLAELVGCAEPPAEPEQPATNPNARAANNGSTVNRRFTTLFLPDRPIARISLDAEASR